MMHESARERATRAQKRASDPSHSAWVSANAGSGKTRVLTNRVARLLLSGCPPDRILCLTYTKAAAAEMSKRLFTLLGDWSVMPDERLTKDIGEFVGRSLAPEDLSGARRLFAAALETPGGLQIQTIHAFCQRILRRFPVEAGLPPDFDVLDDARRAAFAKEALRRTVSPEQENGPLSDAVRWVLTSNTDWSLNSIAAESLRCRVALSRFLEKFPTQEARYIVLSEALGIDPQETEERVLSDRCRKDLEEDKLWPAAAAMRGAANKTDLVNAEKMTRFLESGDREQLFDEYRSIFLTTKGTQRKDIATKTLIKCEPWIDMSLRREADRLITYEERLRSVRNRARSGAALTISQAVFKFYEELKRSHRALDYDDLIEAVLGLLSEDVRAWVQFKLDGGIDHILIDEAQDTSPDQWRIVEYLATEFFAHPGEPVRPRTIFAVGDKKQSIFSFQGADPGKFTQMRDRFAAAARAAEHNWESVELDVSFRSASEILGAVDATFSHAPARTALTATDEGVSHIAERVALKGLVELWPPLEALENLPAEPWTAPVDYRGAASPERRLAERIAAHIRRCLDEGEWLSCQSGPIGPGDILILVRDRSTLFYELIRSLKKLDLDVAGTDQMKLREEIAFLDLEAIARASLLASDDLALAEVLKGPLFRFSDEDLMNFALGREGNLWKALSEWKTAKGVEATTKLSRLKVIARSSRPYEFLQACLGEGGRHAFLAALGREAEDVIEELLSLALDYETEEAPTLQGFLAWLERTAGVVKRDLEQARDKIRVMTVHGSKGLEAPIVFLPQTHVKRKPQRGGPWLHDLSKDVWLWPGAANEDDTLTRQLKQAVLDEEDAELHRLLYVAMTRAQERLYVCGITNRTDKPDESWHGLVRRAMGPKAEEFEVFPGEMGLRLGHAGVAGEVRTECARPSIAGLPDWARSPAVTEVARLRRAPSTLTQNAEVGLVGNAPAGRVAAIARGLHVHRLLELVAGLSADAREETARYLSRNAMSVHDAKERSALLREVLGVLGDPRFSAVFGSGSRAEVRVAGVVEGSDGQRVTISGQIDRLLVEEDRVLAVDYKTGLPPRDVSSVPPGYLAQMAAYRALLIQLYPGRQVDVALLWTQGPSLMPLDSTMLDVIAVTESAS